MATVTATPPTNTQASSTGNSNEPLRGLDMDQFLKLMITELQNQDPLNPMDNAQILQQISQIREIQASDQMRDTLQSVLLGQNLASASGMLNKQVTGLTDSGDEVQGTVTRVSVADNKVSLTIDGKQVSLTNIREVVGG